MVPPVFNTGEAEHLGLAGSIPVRLRQTFLPEGSATSERGPAPVDPGPALEMRTGDDVVHASFGDGVVTGAEPGGVIVVRFDDGKERKLMADYAPIRKK